MTSNPADIREDDTTDLVVNCEHLMAYVEGQKTEGNAAYRKGNRSEALAAWGRGLAALGQADGRPITRSDLAQVQKAKATLYSNRGQALLAMKFWRRAADELSKALEADAANAKALWRRHAARKGLKDYAAAEQDLKALLDLPGATPGVAELLADAKLATPDRQAAALEALRGLALEAEREADRTLRARAEEAATKSIERLRERFEEVTRRTGLHGDSAKAAELADMLLRPEGVTAEHVANTYQLDDDDAEVITRWIQTATRMKTAIEAGGAR